jgi:outer membrane protein assembly factor BamE (lipoprotein component of BamABCDE complex)
MCRTLAGVVLMVLLVAALSGCSTLDLGGNGRDGHVYLDTDKIGTGNSALWQEPGRDGGRR